MNQIVQNNFSSIAQMSDKVLGSKTIQTKEAKTISFQEILDTTQGLQEKRELKFSKHAHERLNSRNIDLSKEQLERLENGVDRAREKGIKESLVMIDDLAFIVNLKKNIVVTAVNETETAIFTNIDGAVFS